MMLHREKEEIREIDPLQIPDLSQETIQVIPLQASWMENLQLYPMFIE